MLRRFTIYMVGVGMGCVITYFLLFRNGDHKLDQWLPENRVLEQVRDSLIYPPVADCLLECYQIDKKSIDKILLDGDVDFSKSEVKQEPKIYFISGESVSGKQVEMKVNVYKRYSEMGDVKDIGSTLKCDCND